MVTNQIFEYLKDMEEHITSLKDISSDLIDISQLSSIDKDIAKLLVGAAKMIDRRISDYDITNTLLKRLLKEKDSIENIPMRISEIHEERMPDMQNTIDTLSLRPHTEKQDKGKSILIIPQIEDTEVSRQQIQMKKLFSLTNTEMRYIDFSGIYPRINYLQGSDSQEIRYWYDFGAVNTIYTASPEFKEISQLPNWIQEGVKDCYLHNPMIKPGETLLLKIYSAGPDFLLTERYPAFHYIQLFKLTSVSISIPTDKKVFQNFTEKDIAYRRAIGIRIVMQAMESCFKQGFRTYGGKYLKSSIMTTPAKITPKAAHNYLKQKIKYLEGQIKSSPTAQKKICEFRKHTINTCPACTKHEDDASSSQMSTNSDRD